MKRIRLVFAVAAATAVLTMAAGPASALVPLPTDLGPPQCEKGQLRAAENALTRGNVEQAAKHSAKAAACLAGLPPGQGGLPTPV